MFCHGGLQGTFPARADLPQPSEFQKTFAMETWLLAATKTKKSHPSKTKIQFNLPRFCARVYVFFSMTDECSHSNSTKTVFL